MLTRTLVKTRAVIADMQRAAEGLAIVGTVLEQELPVGVRVGDVALAIAHAGDIEKKLADSVKKLAEVRDELDLEVRQRVETTRQRDESEARLEALVRKTD